MGPFFREALLLLIILEGMYIRKSFVMIIGMLLIPSAPLHYPIPGKELEVLLMDNYTFGGQN